MIELSRHPDGEVLYVSPSALASITRYPDGEFTEIVLAIQGPRDTGPICYRVMESPETVWQKWSDANNSALDARLHGLNSVLQAMR
jgi:hypothetical protein